jgi:5-methylcytosine-specific restriction enzyme A
VSVSFSKFCEELGAPLHNVNWSWCAISHEKRFALFTVWEDQIVDGRYEFTTKPRASDVRKKAGRTELLRVLDTVIANGYAAYGIQCRAVDYEANPRKRKSFEIDSLLDMRVRFENDDYIGQIVGYIPPKVVSERGDEIAWIASTAINDIEQDHVGNDDPEYRKRMSGSYVRDAKVRDLVLKRAAGICEECNQRGFLKADGKVYLETHHVISLSEQGPDKPHNIIALCANDHRRAHFGRDWKEMQDRFLEKLSKYRIES